MASKDTATAIELQNNESIIIPVQDNDDVNNIKQPVYVRWDHIFRNYIFVLLIAGLAIGGSVNTKYDRAILFGAFIHFASESSMSFYFLYSRNVAYKLSIIWSSLCILEGCIGLYLGTSDIMIALFQLHFIASDSFSIMSSLCVLYNKEVHAKLHKLAFATSLHFIGVSLEMYTLPIELYSHSVIPQHGAGWVWLTVVSIPQIYLCQNVIKGELNDVVGEVSYNEKKNSKCFIYFAQFCVPILSFLVLPLFMFVGVLFRTTEGNGITMAFGIWADLACTIFWPICMFNILWIVYVWTNSHPLKNKE